MIGRPLTLASLLLTLSAGTLLQAQTQSPYAGTNGTIANGSTLQAENYDLGGAGIAYNDTTAGNTGGAYRTDNVDIEACTDTGGGFNVGWLINAEWLEYTVNTTAGTYTITARVASAGAAVGDLRVLLDGVVLGTIAVNATGGWQTFADASISNVSITAGSNRVLRLELVNGGDFNVNYVRFTGAGPTPTATARPTATATTRATATATTRATATATTRPAGGCAIGATCEAETALLGGGVVTSTLHAGYTGSGFADYQGNGTGFVEWTVSVPTAGTYNLNIRYGNGGTADRPMSIQVNGATVVSSLSFPVTGWTIWTVRTQSVSLPAGSVRIRATELPNGPNVDSLAVTSGGGDSHRDYASHGHRDDSIYGNRHHSSHRDGYRHSDGDDPQRPIAVWRHERHDREQLHDPGRELRPGRRGHRVPRHDRGQHGRATSGRRRRHRGHHRYGRRPQRRLADRRRVAGVHGQQHGRHLQRRRARGLRRRGRR